MSQKIYVVEEHSSYCGEASGQKLVEAYLSKEKAIELKDKLEEIERKLNEADEKCMDCRFDNFSYKVENIKTFDKRAKQFCKDANFELEEDGYGNLWLECQGKPPERWDYHYYYITETELVNG